MRLVVYARVSKERQTISLRDQKQQMRQYCKLFGHELVVLIASAESAKSIRNRDDFQRALQLLRDGSAEGLLVHKLDRLCRDLGDAQDLLREFFGPSSKHRKHLLSVCDAVDTTTPNGLLQFNLQMAFAQWERQTIAARVKGALDSKRRNGEVVGATPYGWTATPSGKLRKNAKEQRGIALAKRLRKAGYSYASTCAELDRRGFKPKNGGRWGSSALQRILKRRS